jgi:putative NIF3 family GTP cyclohydrolase 1 type 2
MNISDTHDCMTVIRYFVSWKAGFVTESPVCTVAVCAGSGSSVLKGVKADLYLTGEMQHHDVLDAVHRGTHVVLCDHSNTERGFLKVFAEKLAADLCGGNVEVVMSQVDRDPLQVI